MSTKIEFAVQMTCESCVKAVKQSLEGVKGIENVDINLNTNTVIVDTTLQTSDVLKKIQSTGRKVVVKGFAGLAGVAILDTGEQTVKGVVRFVQTDADLCIIDGTVDGLRRGEYGLAVHETGDLSKGCDSTGSCFNPQNERSNGDGRAYGYLGIVTAGEDGRSTFRLQDKVLKLSEVIGRSLVVSENPVNNALGRKLVCGIIARSAGLFENPKTICACDGISIWDESEQPKKASL